MSVEKILQFAWFFTYRKYFPANNSLVNSHTSLQQQYNKSFTANRYLPFKMRKFPLVDVFLYTVFMVNQSVIKYL